MVVSLFSILALAGVSLAKIQQVVFFGDSFTVCRSRSHSIANGTAIGKNYQEVYPPTDVAASGGFQWPFYLGLYGGYKIWNYAVGGAVCNNYNTPLQGYPDVINGQTAWFVEDHITGVGTGHQKLGLDPSEFVVIIWIGTNDVGLNNFITSGQPANVSLPDVVDCQLQTVKKLYGLGARNFIVNSMIPLQLTRLYANNSAPMIYWPEVHDGNLWNKAAYNYVHTVNRMVQDGVSVLQKQWSGTKQGGSIEYFDTYGFFEQLYNNPTQYFNGSIPANVTGHCHQCPVPTDWRYCGIGDCTSDQRDSYMWWDELHPSEQTGRNLAAEILKKIHGKSTF